MQIDEIYIGFIVRYLKKEASENENKRLFEWVYSNSEHEKFFYVLKDIWETSRYKQVADEAASDIEWQKFALKAIEVESAHYLQRNDKLHRIFRLMRIAAVLILAMVAGFFIHQYMPRNPELVSVNVPLGAKTNLELPDGSNVWVNSGSRLTYPSDFNGKRIDMTLDGEAYFEITHNPHRRINIHTSSIVIQVLGTTFNVKSYNDDDNVETTLVNGLISITGKVGNKVIEPVLLRPKEQATLIKGEKKIMVSQVPDYKSGNNQPGLESEVASARLNPALQISGKIDVEPVTSWKDNILVFKSERFEDLARKMERWYDVKISITHERLKEARYTGKFENESIEQAMKALSLSLPFNYTIEKNQIEIVLRK